jgi:hypothetical protein
MQELAEQISETQLEILAIQEIRGSGTDLIKNNTHYIIMGLVAKQDKLVLDLCS